MQIRTLSLDFLRQGAAAFPKDPELHKLVVAYCERELSKPIVLADYAKVLVSCWFEDDKIVKIDSIACIVNAVDVPVIRFTSKEAGDSLMERMRAYLEDMGLRGSQIFIHIADREPKDARCPMWRKFLKKWKATKASRWSATV